MSRAKIVCTIGPASDSDATLRRLILAGMDVARLNFSHGSHGSHAKRIRAVRRASKSVGRRVRILLDLAGYRIRVGWFVHHEGVQLRKRQTLRLVSRDLPGTDKLVPFDYRGPLDLIPKGAKISIDDGNIELTVTGHGADFVKAQVVVPGLLKERKGINIPAARLRFEGFTEKDEKDLRFGIEHGVDDVAQSFVRDARDVRAVRTRLGRSACRVIAKIENHEGICNIDEIITASDGIMVARGDMGVCLPIHEIPMIQKMIIEKCNRKKRFVITATQMLETMTDNLRPKRAEVSDVANAILDGSDYVMLSGETAIGKYPVQTVRLMNDIIEFTEKTRSVDFRRYCRFR